MPDNHPARMPSPPVRPFVFFALTYVLSLLIWIPLDLSHFNIGSIHIPAGTGNIVQLLGVLTPSIAALVLTAFAGGTKTVRGLLRPFKVWRVGCRWWGAGLLAQPALLLLAALIYNLIWSNAPVAFLSLATVSSLLVSIFFLFLATLGEEVGWRGWRCRLFSSEIVHYGRA